MNIFSIYFILIQLCGIFQKFTNCLFELQMPFSQNDAISDFTFFWVCRLIFPELNTLWSCVLYLFNGNFCVRARYLNNSNIYICNLRLILPGRVSYRYERWKYYFMGQVYYWYCIIWCHVPANSIIIRGRIQKIIWQGSNLLILYIHICIILCEYVYHICIIYIIYTLVLGNFGV